MGTMFKSILYSLKIFMRCFSLSGKEKLRIAAQSLFLAALRFFPLNNFNTIAKQIRLNAGNIGIHTCEAGGRTTTDSKINSKALFSSSDEVLGGEWYILMG
jgi:hypothetical protein